MRNTQTIFKEFSYSSLEFRKNGAREESKKINVSSGLAKQIALEFRLDIVYATKGYHVELY